MWAVRREYSDVSTKQIYKHGALRYHIYTTYIYYWLLEVEGRVKRNSEILHFDPGGWGKEYICPKVIMRENSVF